MKKKITYEEPYLTINENGEKTKNPNEITINQHIISARHISRFADSREMVQIKRQGKKFQTDTQNNIFTTQRLWSQSLEAGLMKSIEDSFHNQIQVIIDKNIITDHNAISLYYALWCARYIAKIKGRPTGKKLINICNPMPKDAVEKLDLDNINQSVKIIGSSGDDCQSISREVVDEGIEFDIRGIFENLKNKTWAIISAEEGSFICPDNVLNQYVIPISPKRLLILGDGNHSIGLEGVAYYNLRLRELASDFYFGSEHFSPFIRNKIQYQIKAALYNM